MEQLYKDAEELGLTLTGFLLEEGKIIEETFEKGGRWSNFRTYIIEYKGKYYSTYEEVPATECQEGADFDEGTPIEVKPVKKMIEVTEWEEVTQ